MCISSQIPSSTIYNVATSKHVASSSLWEDKWACVYYAGIIGHKRIENNSEIIGHFN